MMSAARVLKLNCWVLGDDTNCVFPVKISETDNVGSLKDEVKKENQQSFKDVDAKRLELWKVSISVAALDDQLKKCQDPKDVVGALKLQPLIRLSNVFPTNPAEEHLHIIVSVPDAEKVPLIYQMASVVGEVLTRAWPKTASEPITGVRGSKRPRLGSSHGDITSKILTLWSKRPKRLPSISELSGLLDEPLSDNEKIPLNSHDFSQLLSTLPHDICVPEDVEILFRISELEHSFSLRTLFTNAVTDRTPPESGTEASFHAIWDDHIRKVLDVLKPEGVSIRDSSRHTSTEKLSPDFGFLLNNVCLFRGEEKSQTSVEDPKAELCDKLTWIYSPAPYIFAYHAVGMDVTLSAICAPRMPSAKPTVEDLATTTLRLRRERILHLRRIIRLSCFMPLLLDLVGYRSDPDFHEIRRLDKTVQVGLKNVKKTYHGPNAKDRARYLYNIYAILLQKGVCHVDHATSFNEAEATLYLEPKGIVAKPTNETELLDALVCVLEALVDLHQEPPLFHRDIRWANVIRSANNPSSWFLIDWEDAAGPNNVAAQHLCHESHSPRLLDDNHGGEVDVWGVGLLIKESCSNTCNISAKLLALGEWMQKEGPTSLYALAAIMVYKDDLALKSTASGLI